MRNILPLKYVAYSGGSRILKRRVPVYTSVESPEYVTSILARTNLFIAIVITLASISDMYRKVRMGDVTKI